MEDEHNIQVEALLRQARESWHTQALPALEQAIQSLEEPDDEIIHLSFYMQAPDEEIAGLLNLQGGAQSVRDRINKILSSLAQNAWSDPVSEKDAAIMLEMAGTAWRTETEKPLSEEEKVEATAMLKRANQRVAAAAILGVAVPLVIHVLHKRFTGLTYGHAARTYQEKETYTFDDGRLTGRLYIADDRLVRVSFTVNDATLTDPVARYAIVAAGQTKPVYKGSLRLMEEGNNTFRAFDEIDGLELKGEHHLIAVVVENE